MATRTVNVERWVIAAGGGGGLSHPAYRLTFPAHDGSATVIVLRREDFDQLVRCAEMLEDEDRGAALTWDSER